MTTNRPISMKWRVWYCPKGRDHDEFHIPARDPAVARVLDLANRPCSECGGRLIQLDGDLTDEDLVGFMRCEDAENWPSSPMGDWKPE